MQNNEILSHLCDLERLELERSCKRFALSSTSSDDLSLFIRGQIEALVEIKNDIPMLADTIRQRVTNLQDMVAYLENQKSELPAD